MSDDPTEGIRRAQVEAINAAPGSREALEAQNGQVWNTEELTRDFEVCGFMSPYILVIRRSDGVKGTMIFQHTPRFYWGFERA